MGMVCEFDLKRVSTLMIDLSRFFVQFEPVNDSNLYVRFLDEFKNSLNDIVFSCTLNYDIIFELAAKRLGLEIDYLSTETEKLRFWKLHGSCDFFAKSGFFIGNSGLNSISIDKFRVASKKEVCDNLYNEPIMNIYMPGKPSQILCDDLRLIQRVWREKVSNANKILIIGLRPNTDDHHIWDSISTTEAKIGYVGEYQEFKNWRKKFRKAKTDKFLGDKWNSSFEKCISFFKDY